MGDGDSLRIDVSFDMQARRVERQDSIVMASSAGHSRQVHDQALQSADREAMADVECPLAIG
jgi:hypothetical protein